LVNDLLCLFYSWNLTEGNRPLSIYEAQTLVLQIFSVDCKTIKIGHLITRIKNRFPNQKINHKLRIADRLGTTTTTKSIKKSVAKFSQIFYLEQIPNHFRAYYYLNFNKINVCFFPSQK